MRIRVTFDVRLERRKPPAAPVPAPERPTPPQVDAKSSAHIERAGEQRIGFEVPAIPSPWGAA